LIRSLEKYHCKAQPSWEKSTFNSRLKGKSTKIKAPERAREFLIFTHVPISNSERGGILGESAPFAAALTVK
jgi:hypothetical protein